MKANDIIEGALKKLVVIPAGGSATTAQKSDGLVALNDIVTSWSANASMVYQDDRESIVLPAGTREFTLGQVSADFTTDTPTEVISAVLRDNANNEYPLKTIDVNVFDHTGDKSRTNRPRNLYFRNTYPNSTFYFDVFSDEEYTLVLTSMKELSQFPDGTTDVSLPGYYKKAFIDALTIEIAPQMGAAKRVTTLMIKSAEASEAQIIGKSVKARVSATELSLPRGRRNVNADNNGN